MIKYFSVTVCLVSFIVILDSCGNKKLDGLEPNQDEIASQASVPVIRHLVFLNIKDSLYKDSKKHLIDQINSLALIPYVRSFDVGSFYELDDKRAMREYELILDMSFDSEEDYEAYQESPEHLAVKSELKPSLQSPPLVYDYQIP